MKKIIKYIIIVFTIIFLAFIAVIINTKNKMTDVNLSYRGIEGKKINYTINENGLKCNLDRDTKLKNSDKIKLECSDSIFSFVKFDKEYTINGLYSDSLDTNKKFIAIENLIFPFERYLYKETEDGIEVIKIALENNKYEADIYYNLFFDNEKLVKLDDLNNIKIDSRYTDIKPGAKVTNIERKYIDEYIQKYTDLGYKLK